MAILSSNAKAAVTAFNTLADDDEKSAALTAMKAANPGIIPKDNAGKLALWKMLFATLGTLGVILGSGGVGLLFASHETGAAIVFAPVSAIIAGMFGLFATSPGDGG